MFFFDVTNIEFTNNTYWLKLLSVLCDNARRSFKTILLTQVVATPSTVATSIKESCTYLCRFGGSVGGYKYSASAPVKKAFYVKNKYHCDYGDG